MSDDPEAIRIARDGLPYPKSVDAFLRLDPQTQASLIGAHQAETTGGSAASSITVRRNAEPPRIILPNPIEEAQAWKGSPPLDAETRESLANDTWK